MSERVLLHVGCPKTGTSYLQDVLFRNQALLREHDILYPADRFDAHFLAALDLMTLPWGGLETEAVGAWERLAEQVREWHGTAIISHEIFARATPTQVERALASLGDAEVHVVLSVRDLVRQIPAEWQENVKHRSHITYASFLETIRDPARGSKIGSWFWAVQEIPDILGRWGASLPADRVHLVTVPPSGSDRGELWRRFSRTFGLDDLPLDLTAERENPSLGVPETSLLRTINQRVTSILAPPDYRPLVRELLAHQTLSRGVASARLGLAPDDHAWAQDLSRTLGGGARRAGVRRRRLARRPPRPRPRLVRRPRHRDRRRAAAAGPRRDQRPARGGRPPPGGRGAAPRGAAGGARRARPRAADDVVPDPPQGGHQPRGQRRRPGDPRRLPPHRGTVPEAKPGGAAPAGLGGSSP